MSFEVDPNRIEKIVGVKRKNFFHIGRGVSAEFTMYIMHSHSCRKKFADLRECPYSVAMDQGLDQDVWKDMLDIPVWLEIRDGRLVPLSECHE